MKQKNKKIKPSRNMADFFNSEKGGINKDKVIKIGGLTLGLLGGIVDSDALAARAHTNTVDLVFDPTAPGTLGAHTNTVSWSWSNCSCSCCCA